MTHPDLPSFVLGIKGWFNTLKVGGFVLGSSAVLPALAWSWGSGDTSQTCQRVLPALA